MADDFLSTVEAFAEKMAAAEFKGNFEGELFVTACPVHRISICFHSWDRDGISFYPCCSFIVGYDRRTGSWLTRSREVIARSMAAVIVRDSSSEVRCGES